MSRRKIELDSFRTDIFKVLNKEWMLLTSGDAQAGSANTMTVSWGFMGTIWFKPVAIAAVRPQRYTREFMEKYDNFTLCALPESKSDLLSFCGASSGRDVDKIKECGLTPIASEHISSPGFDEAELIIECRVIYKDDLKQEHFLDRSIIPQCYPANDFHRIYFGEVLNIAGADKYCA